MAAAVEAVAVVWWSVSSRESTFIFCIPWVDWYRRSSDSSIASARELVGGMLPVLLLLLLAAEAEEAAAAPAREAVRPW